MRALVGVIIRLCKEVMIRVHEVRIIQWDTPYQCTGLSKEMMPSPVKETIIGLFSSTHRSE